jgi:hypothetical protein
MKLQLLSVLSVLIYATIGTAQILPTGSIFEYQPLYKKCESGGNNTVSIPSHHFHTNFNNSDMITVHCGSVLGRHRHCLQLWGLRSVEPGWRKSKRSPLLQVRNVHKQRVCMSEVPQFIAV